MRNFNYSALEMWNWDSEILGLVTQIHEYKGKQEVYTKQKSETLSNLVEIAKIQSTEASNEIEGIITTGVRLKQLFIDKTTPRNRDEQEILGYRDVLNTIHDNYEYIPVKSSYILQLHKILYQYSQKSIGGAFKNTQNIIAETRANGEQYIRFKPLSPFETPIAMDMICESYNQTIDASLINPLILISIFINDFLCIHPFNDGNGRMSRLLMTLLLYQQGYVVGKYISIESKIQKTKLKYYEVLELCNEGWHEEKNDPTPFIKYCLGIILSAYRDLEKRIDIIEAKLPAIEQVRIAINKTIGKFTKNDIMEMVPTVGKASIENSLKQLVIEGIIVRHNKGKATFYTRID